MQRDREKSLVDVERWIKDGKMFLEDEKYKESLKNYEEAIKKEENNAEALFGKGLALYKLREYKRAIKALEKASKMDNAFSEQIEQFPSAYTQFMVALDFGIGPSYEVVIVGTSDAGDTIAMLSALRTSFTPNKVVILRPSEKTSRQSATR